MWTPIIIEVNIICVGYSEKKQTLVQYKFCLVVFSTSHGWNGCLVSKKDKSCMGARLAGASVTLTAQLFDCLRKSL